jgi:hypothetical protein
VPVCARLSCKLPRSPLGPALGVPPHLWRRAPLRRRFGTAAAAPSGALGARHASARRRRRRAVLPVHRSPRQVGAARRAVALRRAVVVLLRAVLVLRRAAVVLWWVAVGATRRVCRRRARGVFGGLLVERHFDLRGGGSNTRSRGVGGVWAWHGTRAAAAVAPPLLSSAHTGWCQVCVLSLSGTRGAPRRSPSCGRAGCR